MDIDQIGSEIIYATYNDVSCPNCHFTILHTRVEQGRAGDEFVTIILTCEHCTFSWNTTS